MLLVLLSNPGIAQFQSSAVEFTVIDNTNIGLADSEPMQDQAAQVRLSGQSYFERSVGSGIFIQSSISATAYKNYNKLDSREISTEIGYSKKFGLGLQQPRLSASVALGYRDSASAIRSGWSASPALRIKKNLSNRTLLTGTLRYYRFEANNKLDLMPGQSYWVSSTDSPASVQNTQLQIGAEWAWMPSAYLSFTTTYVQGDFSSVGSAYSGTSYYADAVSRDDLCGYGCNLYRYDGDGVISNLGLIYALSDRTELKMNLQRGLIKATGSSGYDQNLASLSISRGF